MRVRSTAIRAGLAALLASLVARKAGAAIVGAPESGGIGFLPGNSQIADDIFWLHNGILLPVIFGICLLVLGLIVSTVWRFNETANPVPSRRTHNGLLEVAWTVFPALTLVVIAVPSFRLLADQLIIPAPDLTVKVTASQWHWNYGYPKSEGGFSFDSLYVEDKDLKPGQPRLITADHEMVVPVGKVIEVDVTSQDVIHSFSVPSFGIKIDAIPRPNSTKRGSKPTTRACSTDNAPTSAALTTRSCRSTSASPASRTTRPGSLRRRKNSRSWTAWTSRRRRSSIPKSAPSWACRS